MEVGEVDGVRTIGGIKVVEFLKRGRFGRLKVW